MVYKSKRFRAESEKVSKDIYPIDEALDMVKECASARFNESVEFVVRLGVDTRKSDQVVRGASKLPHGTGSEVRVAVFTSDEKVAEEAIALGAKAAGLGDLIEDMKAGNLPYDVVIASPESMPSVGKLGQVLGPKGLMPNPKVGTVAIDVLGAVADALKGQVIYRTDKSGQIHCQVGKVSFDRSALRENIQHLMGDVQKSKPSSAKGRYVLGMSVCSTMGPGISVDVSTLV